MTLKTNVLIVLLLLLLGFVLAVGAQADIDYPPPPEHSVPFFTGYSNYRLDAVCGPTAQGLFVYNITADPNYPTPDAGVFDVWARYNMGNNRWPAGRYGLLRPYRVQVFPGQNNYVAVESQSARIARGGLTDYRQSARAYNVPPCPTFGPENFAVILAEFPQTDVVYNPPGAMYTPPPLPPGAGAGQALASPSACTDIVNLVPDQPYRVYELRPDGSQNTIDSGTLGYGASLNLSRFTVTVYVEMGGRVQRYDC